MGEKIKLSELEREIVEFIAEATRLAGEVGLAEALERFGFEDAPEFFTFVKHLVKEGVIEVVVMGEIRNTLEELENIDIWEVKLRVHPDALNRVH